MDNQKLLSTLMQKGLLDIKRVSELLEIYKSCLQQKQAINISRIIISKGYVSQQLLDEVYREIAEQNRVIGHYQVKSELGRGGMGVVYKVFDLKLQRFAAMKLALGNDPNLKERFMREAQATAKLKHSNIVEIYEVGYTPQNYFTMEYVEGTALRNKIAVLKPRETAKIMEKVALAVHFAHENKIIHRDIKPDNIMLTPNHTPKIMDFGLAKLIDIDHKLSQTGVVLGTPAYSSPEQINGEKVGPKSDIYSLGATLYEVLTGRVPFQAQTYANIAMQINESDPISPRQLNPDIPLELEAICLKCMEKKTQNRYSNARMLAKDLCNFVENRAIIAKPAGKFTHIKKLVGRNKLFFVLLSIIFLLLFFGVFSYIGLQQGTIKRINKEKEKAENALQALQLAYKKLKEETLLRKKAEKKSKFLSFMEEINRLVKNNASKIIIEERIKLSKKISPNLALFLQQKSRVYFDLGKRAKDLKKQKRFFEKSLEAGQECIQKDPDNYKACFYCWQIYSFRGRGDKAHFFLQKIIKINPDNEYGYLGRGVKLVNEAKTSKNKKAKYDKAIFWYKKALALNPRFYYIYNNLGTIYQKLNKHQQAIGEFKKSIAIFERNLAYFNLGKSYNKIGKHKEALRCFERYAQLAPGDPDSFVSLAETHAFLNHHTKAIDLYLKALPRSSEKFSILTNIGISYLRLNQLEKAFKYAQKAQQVNPNYAIAYSLLGNIFDQGRQPQKAITYFKKAIALDKNYADAYDNLAAVYVSLQKYSQALALYQKVQKLSSNDHHVYFNLGVVYHFLGDIPKGISYLLHSIKLFPRDAKAHYYLSIFYFKTRQFDNSFSSLEDAIKLNPFYKEKSAKEAIWGKFFPQRFQQLLQKY